MAFITQDQLEIMQKELNHHRSTKRIGILKQYLYMTGLASAIVMFIAVGCKKKYVEIIPTIKLTHLNSPTTNNLTSVDFINSNTGYVAGRNGVVYKTSNQGQSWAKIDFPSTKNIYKILFLNEDTGYVGNERGVYRTVDGGTNWVKGTQSGGIQIVIDATDIYFVNDQVGFVVDGGSYGKTYRTTNGGNSWVEKDRTLSPTYAIHMFNKDSGYAVGEDQHFFETRDGGTNWSNDMGSGDRDSQDIYYQDWNNGYVVGDHGYVGAGYFYHEGGYDYTNEYTYDLFAIDFYGSRGVVVGEFSVLIPYQDSDLHGVGLLWENMLAPDGTTIQITYKGVSFADQNTFYAVGNGGSITQFIYPE